MVKSTAEWTLNKDQLWPIQYTFSRQFSIVKTWGIDGRKTSAKLYRYMLQ